MDCPRRHDCPLSSPLLLEAARTYLAGRYCPPGQSECALRRPASTAAAERAELAVAGAGRSRPASKG